jgi:hypothetical protein
MNYLLFVEHAPENLQFFLWVRDYAKRFDEMISSDKSLSPEWTQSQQDAAVQLAREQLIAAKGFRKEPAKALFSGTDFEKTQICVAEPKDPFSTPPRTADENFMGNGNFFDSTKASSDENSYHASSGLSAKQLAGEAFTSAGLKEPCKLIFCYFNACKPDMMIVTIQPFREEIDLIIATYIQQGSPRELNLSGSERSALLRALQHTTHPSAFGKVYKTVEYSLRKQAHPNFVRWSICNGNPARVWFARGLGVVTIILSLIAAIILTTSRVPRGWRALPALGWIIGGATLIAGYKGMCVVLHGMHHRHVRPWELFEECDVQMDEGKQSFDSTLSSNSYEDQPWVVKYEKRNLIRKVFDREVWIQEPALRQIQDTIFLQAILGGVLLAGICMAIFMPIPRSNLF